MSIKHLSNHILAVAHQLENPITNLQLQKVLFFTVGMSIRHKPEELEYFNDIYNDDFEKWRYGPVVPSIYFSYNIYGDKQIDDEGKYHEELKRFDEMIKKLLKIDVYRLVALSHKMDAWLDYERDILTGRWVRPYTIEEIARDFNNA